MIPVSIVVAVAQNGVIGRDNTLAWRLRTDLRRFKQLTLGKPMIMGRKTFESIGRPLPGRETVVLTRDRGFHVPGVQIARDWGEAVRVAGALANRLGAAEIAVVGGAEVFRLALPNTSRIHLTEVHAQPDGDVRFPDYDRSLFAEISREDHPASADDEHAFAFVDLVRRTDGWETARETEARSTLPSR